MDLLVKKGSQNEKRSPKENPSLHNSKAVGQNKNRDLILKPSRSAKTWITRIIEKNILTAHSNISCLMRQQMLFSKKMQIFKFCFLLWLLFDAVDLKKVVQKYRTSSKCSEVARQLLPECIWRKTFHSINTG